ncbi:MAG: hypothetical protein NTZ82_05740 [Bacteroidetes bacterium]|nr:hypothetical protein [Bacteroidota bacterium]
MRRFLFLLLGFAHFGPLQAQELTGKWNGYFIPNNDQESHIYIYNVEIEENEKHELSVVTYTNLTGNFSAKAIASGFYSVNTKLVSINETKFEDVNVLGNMQACLMMNFLTFTNNRGRGILQGTYISKNEKGTKDCGGGKVYLEKEFLIVKNKKETPVITEQKNAKSPIDKSATSLSNTKTKFKPAVANVKISTPLLAPLAAAAPNKKEDPVTIANATSIVATTEKTVVVNKPPEITNQTKEVKNETASTLVDPGTNNADVLPWVLVGRENKLIKRVITNSKTISLDLYDNGTIDNDTIIIYDNNKVIANLKRLSYKAIHLELTFSASVLEHEIVVVAHNMGTIPPNTALVVLNDANTRKEFYISTTTKLNAKFEFVYKPSD